MSTGERTTWVDTAKGLAIVLVVFVHSEQALANHQAGSQLWHRLDVALTPMRMPLFFLVSGFFAAKALSSPRGAFVRTKVARFAYLYVLWGVILSGVAFLAGQEGQPGRAGQDPFGVALVIELRRFLTIDSGPWYLPALAVFFVVARLARTVPVSAQLAIAAATSAIAGSGVVPMVAWGPVHMAQYFVYFLVGLHFSGEIRSWTERGSLPRLAVFGAVFAATMAAAFGLGVIGSAGAVLLPLVALPFGLSLCFEMDRRRPFGLIRTVGSQTLPVYVLNMPLVWLFTPLFVGLVADLHLLPALIGPPVFAAVTMATALAIHFVTRRVPGLYEPPRRLIQTPRPSTQQADGLAHGVAPEVVEDQARHSAVVRDAGEPARRPP